MLKMDLSLTEGVAETIGFSILSRKQEPVDITGTSWWVVLKRRGDSEPMQLPARIDLNVVLVDFPALQAFPADWELWRSSDSGTELFLGGAVAVFPILCVETTALSTTSIARTFSVLSRDEDSAAWLVKAMPGNAALACLQKIKEAYNAAFTLERVKVESLPPADKASTHTVYYLEGIPWLSVDGDWVQLNASYGPAVPGMPGLLRVEAAEHADICAPVVATEEGCGIKMAEPGKPYLPGSVSLGEDFIANDTKTGLLVRRANPNDGLPGLVSVIGNEEEALDSYPEGYVPQVYTPRMTDQRIRELHTDLSEKDLQGKMDKDGSNAAPGVDIVVQYSHNPDTGTWYRLYKSGWVEQGGIVQRNNDVLSVVLSCPLPVTMKDTSYFAITSISCRSGSGNYLSWHTEVIDNRTTSSIEVLTGAYISAVKYVVYGYAAK
jgi:hypothetical protein